MNLKLSSQDIFSYLFTSIKPYKQGLDYPKLSYK